METKIPPVEQHKQSSNDTPKIPPIPLNRSLLEHEKVITLKLLPNLPPENFDPLLWEMQRRAHGIFKQHPQTDFVEIKNSFWAGNSYHDLPTFVFQNNDK